VNAVVFPCEHCGWMPQDCPCRANCVTLDELDRRHAQAVERAATPTAPAPKRTIVVTGWARGYGNTVAHRFDADTARSVCGLADASNHRHTLHAAPADTRCRKCAAYIARRQETAA
jgi:hypothetical protein